jgi:hypothetical protein
MADKNVAHQDSDMLRVLMALVRWDSTHMGSPRLMDILADARAVLADATHAARV